MGTWHQRGMRVCSEASGGREMPEHKQPILTTTGKLITDMETRRCGDRPSQPETLRPCGCGMWSWCSHHKYSHRDSLQRHVDHEPPSTESSKRPRWPPTPASRALSITPISVQPTAGHTLSLPQLYVGISRPTLHTRQWKPRKVERLSHRP